MRRGNLRRALALAFKRTQRGPLRRVVLYETSDCGLCAEVFRELSRIALDEPIEIERVDIASDVALARYVLRVPVVVVDGRELDAAGLGEGALRGFVTGSS
jgi:predicted thioredoxin/glutaredoxin